MIPATFWIEVVVIASKSNNVPDGLFSSDPLQAGQIHTSSDVLR
jgi:hypothetical protein